MRKPRKPSTPPKSDSQPSRSVPFGPSNSNCLCVIPLIHDSVPELYRCFSTSAASRCRLSSRSRSMAKVFLFCFRCLKIRNITPRIRIRNPKPRPTPIPTPRRTSLESEPDEVRAGASDVASAAAGDIEVAVVEAIEVEELLVLVTLGSITFTSILSKIQASQSFG